MKLYKYSGTIEELAVERGRISYIKLFDVTDFDKAPTRLEVFGALGKYIEAIELTDAEERYIKSDWYFDSSLYDCTGQEFTNWFYLFRRRGHWFAYHSVSRDV